LLNDGSSPEMVAQSLFQRRDFPVLHKNARAQPLSLVLRNGEAVERARLLVAEKCLMAGDLIFLRRRALSWRRPAAQPR
jgi:hypothetical protein